MRLRTILLLLSLSLCAAGFAAPPVITLIGGGYDASIAVPAGHRIAWIKEGSPERSGMIADSDNDGVIAIVSGTNNAGVWVVADVETGEWAFASGNPLTFQPIGAGKILPDAAGNYTQIVLTPSQRLGGGVWVRPGVGAWGAAGSWPLASITTTGITLAISDAAALVPLGSSPARPAGFARGDVLLMAGGTPQSGVVDAAVGAPASPGTIIFNTTSMTSYPREGETVTLDVVRLDGTSGTVAVDYALDVPAVLEAGIDYPVLDSHTVTFGPGETVKKLSVTFPNDSIYTTYARRMTLALQQPTGGAAIGAPSTQAVEFLETDPAPKFVFGAIPASVPEGDTPWTLEVPWSVNGDFRGSAEVSFTAGTHSSNVTVSPGDTQRVSHATIAADDVPTATRTLRLSLSGSFSNAYRDLTILDDDPPAWTTTDVVVYERRSAYGEFRFTVAQPPAGPATVGYQSADGTAKAGQDYTAVASTTSFWQTEAPVGIALQDDSLNEGNETFYIDVVSTSGPLQPPPRTRYAVTIVDDDVPPPPLSMSAQPVLEGSGFGTLAPIVVRLASPATTNVVLNVRPAATGATNSSDYSMPVSTEVEFFLGETEKTISISVRGDYAVEEDETFDFELVSEVTGAVVATTSLTILNDDRLSFISVADATFDESLSEATFLVTFSQSPGHSGSFQYATANGTATAGSDYTAVSGMIAFGPNDTQKQVRVQLTDDSEVEFDETFTLRLSALSAPTGIYLHRDVATATIRDNDKADAPIITLSAASPLEGDSGAKATLVTVRLAAVVLTPVEVTILTQQGTAGAGTDFVPLSTTLTFHPGETEKQVPLDILGDTLGEGDESLTITASHDGAVAASMTLTIKDDDTIYYVSVSDTSVVEGTGGSSTATFRVMFLPPTLSAGTVQYKTEHDTANAGDYAPVSGTMTFTAGETSLTIPVEVFGDATGEKDERFRLRLFNPTGGVLLFDEAGVATIFDDDGPVVRPTLSIDDAAVTETNASSEAKFTLRLSKASETSVSVHYETEDGSARAGTDYETRTGTMTFSPGQLTKTIVIPIPGDEEHEETETFTVLLSNGNGAVIPDLQAVCTITDDDPARTKRRTTRH